MSSPTTSDAPARQDAVFAALASPVRRAVLTLLRERGAQPVHVIAAEFAMRRPSVSEHLKVLLACGLLTEARHGRERHYALRPEPLREVAAWLTPYEQFWRERLGALDALLAEDLDEGAPGHLDEGAAGGEGDARDR